MIKRYLIPLLVLVVPLVTFPGLYNAYFMPKVFVIVTFATIMVCFGYPKKVDKIVIILILLNLLNLFYTQNPYYTRIAVVLNISCLLFYQFTKDHVTLDNLENVIACIAIAGLIVSVLAILNRFGMYPITYLGSRNPGFSIISTIGNSNFIGCYLLFPLFAALYLFARQYRWWLSVFPLIIFAGLIVSRTRASWLGFAVGFILFLFLVFRRRTAVILTALCLVSIITLLSLPIHKYGWYDSKTLPIRLKYWQASVRLWIENPLFGSGMWSYRNKVYEAQRKIIEKNPDWMKAYDQKPRRAHNMYLEMLNDGGLVYFICIMSLFFSALRNGFKYLSKTPREDCLLMAAMVSCLVALMVAGFFFFPLRAPSAMVMTYVLLGVIHAINTYEMKGD